MPLDVPAETIRAALAEAEAALAPADPRLVAVELDAMLEICGTPANWEAVVGFYFEAFEDVPADLVSLAFRRWRLSAKPRPRPGELREQIRDELGERIRVRGKLRFARDQARRREGDVRAPTEAEKREVAALVEALPAIPAGAQPQRVEKRWTADELAAGRRELGLEPAAEDAA